MRSAGAGQWDLGVVQANAPDTDPTATLDSLRRTEDRLPHQIETERQWLLSQGESLVVVGDVSPALAELVVAARQSLKRYSSR